MIAVRLCAPWKRFFRGRETGVDKYEVLQVGVSEDVWLTLEAYVASDRREGQTYWFFHDGGLFNSCSTFPQHEVELELGRFHQPLEAVLGAVAITQAAEQAAAEITPLFWAWVEAGSAPVANFRARRQLMAKAKAICSDLMATPKVAA